MALLTNVFLLFVHVSPRSAGGPLALAPNNSIVKQRDGREPSLEAGVPPPPLPPMTPEGIPAAPAGSEGRGANTADPVS